MKFLIFTFTLIIGEAFATVIFYFVRKEFEKNKNTDESQQHKFFGISSTVFKGILERLVIYIGLILGFPQILIVFGALKIATRISPSEDHKISNDYFLIGNLISIGLAILYCLLYHYLKYWWL